MEPTDIGSSIYNMRKVTLTRDSSFSIIAHDYLNSNFQLLLFLCAMILNSILRFVVEV